jgi:hypothetical protein
MKKIEKEILNHSSPKHPPIYLNTTIKEGESERYLPKGYESPLRYCRETTPTDMWS